MCSHKSGKAMGAWFEGDLIFSDSSQKSMYSRKTANGSARKTANGSTRTTANGHATRKI